MDQQVIPKKPTLSSLVDEEITQDQSPSFNQLHQNISPCLHCTHSNLETSPLHPRSHDSPLCLSPTTLPIPATHPSILYCCISSLCHEDGAMHSMAISGNLLLTGSSTPRIHVWQSVDCHTKGYIQTSSGEIRAMVAHGDMLFTSHKDLKVRIWNMKTSSSGEFSSKKVTTLPSSSGSFMNYYACRSIALQHRDTISCMAFNHVEGMLYTGSFDRTVKVWKLSEKKCVDSFLAHEGNINGMVINQQSGYLFTCSSDGTVKMWLRAFGEISHTLIKVLNFHTWPIYALALSVSPSQRSILYAGSSDGCINFWVQQISYRYVHGGILEGHQFAVLCLVTLENLVISGSEDSTIRIWRREKGRVSHECLAVLEGHRGPVKCLATYLPKDKAVKSFLVYSASLDQTFKIWRVKFLRELTKSPGSYSTGEIDMDEGDLDSTGCEGSPVLSPSWVKKNLQRRSPQIHIN